MTVVRSIADYRRPAGVVGFVPTMGAFHEGHLSLMRAAKRRCDSCVVSLFVNPKQFGPGEDYKQYPRDEARDFELAESAGADIVFAPSPSEVYGDGFSTMVKMGPLGDLWEGAARPGHFDGVATVVAKLFNMVRPDLAFFGEKDFQQCAVISQLVRDLNFPLELVFEPTVREPDGLAMSSRNTYLSDEERLSALAISQALFSAKEAILRGANLQDTLAESREHMERAGLWVDYIALVHGTTLAKLDKFEVSARLIAAAKAGRTRLIDNVLVE